MCKISTQIESQLCEPQGTDIPLLVKGIGFWGRLLSCTCQQQIARIKDQRLKLYLSLAHVYICIYRNIGGLGG